MPRRSGLLALVIFSFLATSDAALSQETPPSVPFNWRTRAERTDYRETGTYDDAIRFMRQVDGASQWVELQFFGTSGQGRAMPLLVVSKDRTFRPEAARATGKPIVLVLGGIHSGEIDGKDASFALVRDLAVFQRHPAILDSVILLVVPMFSVDAHERRSAYNRINQNGPVEMGWRSTPVGLNLNRDWMKVEAVEMQGLLSKVFTQWWPHLMVDCHVTNGADYRHDITFDIGRGPAVPAAVERWGIEVFEGRVLPRLAEQGHLPAPYLTFRRHGEPESGIAADAYLPRFSNTYAPLQCTPAILVETHMLKPYGTRVRATYDALLALLEDIQARPNDLLRAVREAEADVSSRWNAATLEKRKIALTTRLTDRADSIAYKGYRAEWQKSEITGAPVPRYTTDPIDISIPYWRETVPAIEIVAPAGYVVPREWTSVRRVLEIHGVRFHPLTQAWTDSVEMQRLRAWEGSPSPNEGHWPVRVKDVAIERQRRTFRPGDLWVPLDQRSALVAVHLLEARAPDGLAYWNAFDTVLQQKEYAEDYVMEPLARGMLEADPKLARDFRERVASDTTFANNPQARVNFFFQRSKWADPEAFMLPVARALRPPPASVLAGK
jgi:hypothetical protein